MNKPTYAECDGCGRVFDEDNIYPCSDCDMYLCAACDDIHDCLGDDEDEDWDDEDDGWHMPITREAQEAALVAWNDHVAEWNAFQRGASPMLSRQQRLALRAWLVLALMIAGASYAALALYATAHLH